MKGFKALLILTTCAIGSCFAKDTKSEAVYSISYDSSFKNSDKSPFIQKFYYKLTNSTYVNKDFSISYVLKLEQERHSFLDYDSSIIEPEIELNFDFRGKGSFKTFSFHDQVVKVINTTDSFNRFISKTRYDLKFKTDGVLAYERKIKNLSLSLAYGTPKVEQDPYRAREQRNYKVQNTFATSLAYEYQVPNTAVNFYSALSYSKYPLVTQSKYETDVDFYSHYATALTYGKKNRGSYWAFMHNRRDVTMSDLNDPNYYVDGTELIYAYSFANGMRFKTGYEKFKVATDSCHCSYFTTLPVEFMYKFTNDFNIWASARFNLNYSLDEDSSLKEFNDNFELFNGNSYAIGSEYRF